jgi:hypothetical protein
MCRVRQAGLPTLWPAIELVFSYLLERFRSTHLKSRASSPQICLDLASTRIGIRTPSPFLTLLEKEAKYED